MQATYPNFDQHTALIVVDLQNDFVDPRGALHVAGGERLLERINSLIEHARAAGASIIYTQDWHPALTAHFRAYGGPWPAHCVQGTWGAKLHPLLDLHGLIVQKGTTGGHAYSGFREIDPDTGRTRSTALESALRKRQITKVVVIGLATDFCVKETALDAERLNFETTVVVDATTPVNLHPEDGCHALVEMLEAGVHLA